MPENITKTKRFLYEIGKCMRRTFLFTRILFRLIFHVLDELVFALFPVMCACIKNKLRRFRLFIRRIDPCEKWNFSVSRFFVQAFRVALLARRQIAFHIDFVKLIFLDKLSDKPAIFFKKEK